ncbi:SH3 domain-containing protein [Ruminococcus sp.]|uniref:SH3 domain-containing protein n=1 Tax=Ruminococcus sp. TaxID=41978 RepID=UPI0025D7ACFA|nr:SH3 domain-containing protein [Ruminococcus sp.]MBQ9542011.1 SH3 domain-containing protein [Ruminococcus sp.]
MDNEKNSAPASKPSAGMVSVIVAGIFTICMVFIIGRVVFASNAKTAPDNLDTATINTNVTEPQVTETTAVTSAPNAAVTDGSGSVTAVESGAESSASSADDSSSAAEEQGTKYITEYAYLHTQPSNDAENIVCMTPGVAVTVLGYEDNGYVKVTFMSTDGQLTGYIYRDYLSDYQTVLPPWEQ